MVRSHCPPKRAVRRDACDQGVPRLISEPTRPLKFRIDACCGVAPERSVGSNQRVDLGGRQLDPLIAQRRQGADRITQEFQTVFLVGHQATDDHLNGSQRHACTRGGRSRCYVYSLGSWRLASIAGPFDDGINKPRRDATLIASARLVAPSLANSAAQKRTDVGGHKTEHRTNLARRRPLRDQLECVSLRRCDLQDRTASVRRPTSGVDADGKNPACKS